MSGSQYEKLGASASKESLHNALRGAGLSESTNYFCQLYPDIAGNADYKSFVHCDGAGTKSIVAYLHYKETGDASVFKGIAQDALVMNLDDAFAVGPVEGLLLGNAIARNSKNVGEDALQALFSGYKECVENLAREGVTIQLAGGETADLNDVVNTIVVDATLCGRVKSSKLIDTNRIKPGDAIVGFASYGTATYETTANSGVGSNGLTLARHALLSPSYYGKYPEISSPSIGKYFLTDTPDGLNMSVGEALLSPTRSYAPLISKLLGEFGTEIHGIIHNTGGGLTKVLRFGRGNKYLKTNLLPTPALFSLIKGSLNISSKEMFQVFNMGIRLEAYIPQSAVHKAISLAKNYGIEAQQIGSVEAAGNSDGNEVVIHHCGDEILYSHKFN